jgi:hypothetical protein
LNKNVGFVLETRSHQLKVELRQNRFDLILVKTVWYI